MPFIPRYWFDGHQTKTVFVVREMRKNIEILMINSMGRLQLKKIPKHHAETMMSDVDYGARQERSMRASLRRIAKKPGTPANARTAVKEVLS